MKTHRFQTNKPNPKPKFLHNLQGKREWASIDLKLLKTVLPSNVHGLDWILIQTVLKKEMRTGDKSEY